MNQELEPPGEFSATLAACGSSSTFFVDMTDMARLDSNLMTEIVDRGRGVYVLIIWCNKRVQTKWSALEGRGRKLKKCAAFFLGA